MRLDGYARVEIFRAKCSSTFESLHCIAELDQDLGPILPYMNTRLGGHDYVRDPPALILKLYGKLVTVHADRVAVNALRDEAEAASVLTWVLREVEETRAEIDRLEPSTTGSPRPSVVRILSLLPRTNCGTCRAPTCLVFATRLVDGAALVSDCEPLDEDAAESLVLYLREAGAPPPG